MRIKQRTIAFIASDKEGPVMHVELTPQQVAVIRSAADSLRAKEAPLPEHLKAELEGPITDFTYVPSHHEEALTAIYGGNWFTNLNADWQAANHLDAVFMPDETSFSFPLHETTDHGEPITVSIIRSKKPGLPWYMAFVTRKQAVSKNRPANALYDWAFFPGGWGVILPQLASLALEESWDFVEENRDPRFSHTILRNYLTYTFYKLQQDGLVLEDSDSGFAAFNTGLVDGTYEDIYACFSTNNRGSQPWVFEEFCYAGQAGAGKRLVATFNPLPRRASYVTKLEDLVFDGGKRLEADREHILFEAYWVLFRFLYWGQFVDPCLIIHIDDVGWSAVSERFV